jgi:hypothetical protein
LSSKVDEDQTLVNFALSRAKVAGLNAQTEIANAATILYSKLLELVDVFERNSKDMDDQTFPYNVLNPNSTAASILI